jgi:hypothetical protein
MEYYLTQNIAPHYMEKKNKRALRPNQPNIISSKEYYAREIMMVSS